MIVKQQVQNEIIELKSKPNPEEIDGYYKNKIKSILADPEFIVLKSLLPSPLTLVNDLYFVVTYTKQVKANSTEHEANVVACVRVKEKGTFIQFLSRGINDNKISITLKHDLCTAALGPGGHVLMFDAQQYKGLGLGRYLASSLFLKVQPTHGHYQLEDVSVSGVDAETPEETERRNRFYLGMGLTPRWEDDGKAGRFSGGLLKELNTKLPTDKLQVHDHNPLRARLALLAS